MQLVRFAVEHSAADESIAGLFGFVDRVENVDSAASLR
jgi:hypothetical protein